MDIRRAQNFVAAAWEERVLPALSDYIAIPCKSPAFDDDWARRGEIDRAVAHIEAWCRDQKLPELGIAVRRLPGRTPLLLLEMPGGGKDCTLVYGHLDKQPEMRGWAPGLHPWRAVRRGDHLYGRGGADDGYAVFAIVTALCALRDQGIAPGRIVVLIESCEESGSYDLPAYLEDLAPRIGTPRLVVCLDSGCGNYDQLWCTTSLRGIAAGVLHVEILEEGVHAGDAGGVVPSSFRIARALLSRLEDEATGTLRPAALHAEIPEERRRQAAVAGRALGATSYTRFPFTAGAHPLSQDPMQIVLNRSWRPCLEVIGAEGLPEIPNAGNVLRPHTALKLSFRLPPTVNAERALSCIRATLEEEPPSGARVRFRDGTAWPGWHAPPLAPRLAETLDEISRSWFGREVLLMGEGGTIPFAGMLGARFPDAQFVVTGVLGPKSNAHGPNEFLHLPTAIRLTGCLAQLLSKPF